MTYQKDLLEYANKWNRLWKEMWIASTYLERSLPAPAEEHLERFYRYQSEIENSRKLIDRRYQELLAEYQSADTAKKGEMEQDLETMEASLDDLRETIASQYPIGSPYAASWPVRRPKP
jgi:hypothetical protein